MDSAAPDGHALGVEDCGHANDRQPAPTHVSHAAQDGLLQLVRHQAPAVGPVADRHVAAQALAAGALHSEGGATPRIALGTADRKAGLVEWTDDGTRAVRRDGHRTR